MKPAHLPPKSYRWEMGWFRTADLFFFGHVQARFFSAAVCSGMLISQALSFHFTKCPAGFPPRNSQAPASLDSLWLADSDQLASLGMPVFLDLAARFVPGKVLCQHRVKSPRKLRSWPRWTRPYMSMQSLSRARLGPSCWMDQETSPSPPEVAVKRWAETLLQPKCFQTKLSRNQNSIV